jgi:hypothetical protein
VKLPKGPDPELRAAIERADAENHKRGRDIEVGPNCRVILTDTVTGDRYALTSASGALVLTGPL